MATLTLRINDETDAALDALAQATDRSKSYLALRTIDEYLRLSAWQVEAIRAGIAEASTGCLVEHTEVKVRWERRLADSLDKAADRDLDAAADYIGRDDPAPAARTVLRIVGAVAHLVDHPHLGRPGRVPDTRELVIPGLPYLVPYRVRGQTLEVLARPAWRYAPARKLATEPR
jgi:predicted transcriptional regulator/plasmid stabilization system protein ParE